LIVAYDPALHRRFVFSAWCHGSGETFETLHRLMRGGARCAVRVADRNGRLYYAFAIAAGPQTVAWAYTKEALRGQGMMRSLLEHLGVDVNAPMLALFHAPAADALRDKGWPISYESDAALMAAAGP
jgi:hypothetical protein